MSASTDRNLLFGLLALQMDFVTRDALLDAMQAWLLRKHAALAVVLQERGALGAEDGRAVAHLVERHLARHGGDARRSLAALRVETPLRDELGAVGDADVQASVASLAPATVGPVSLPPGPPVRDGGAMRYRKVRFHARGGLGEVHVAVDEELGREVALKEIQGRFADGAEYQARFLREAEITGHLEHPGIVPVYGLGRGPDGRPYYAMRFIRGESLHDAIKRHHQGPSELGLRGLLGRFVAVCQAVAYAHSRGIVHRDLKPANVMLGEYGETLVVDWGLAKLVDVPEGATAIARPVATSASGSTATELGQVVGTPAFMPPEQARGEWDKVDHRSDVWALGAMLYCVLTGQAPYEKDGLSLLGAAAACDYAPARRVNPRVPAALEAVCAKAMAAAPEGRYTSARQLAADVERWLADEAVTAMPEPVREKARRWAKRNRVLVASGVVLLLASVVGLGVGLAAVRAEERRTASERDRAVRAEGLATERLGQLEKERDRAVKAEKEATANFALARKVVDDCFGIAKDHPLLKGPLLTDDMRQLKRLLLEKALPFYQRFRAARPGDKAIEYDTFEHHLRLGLIQNELGSKAEALRSYRAANAVMRQLAKAHPGVAAYRDDLATTLFNLGLLQRGLGQHQDARASYLEAIGLYRALVKAQPGVPGHQADRANALNSLGVLQSDLGQRPEARQSYTEAIGIYRALVKAQPGMGEYHNGLAGSLNNLGNLQRALGQAPEALKSYSEAIALGRALVKAHPGVPALQNYLASVLNNLGNLQWDLGQRAEALKCYDEAATLSRALVKAQPGMPADQEGLARTLNNLGSLYRELGQRTEALKSYTEAAALGHALVKAQPGVPALRGFLATVLNNLGSLQDDLGQGTEALKCYAEAIGLYRDLAKAHPGVPEYQAHLAVTLTSLGLLQRKLNRQEEALRSSAEAVTLGRAVVKAHPAVLGYQDGLANALTGLGSAQQAAGQRQEALKSYSEAAALHRALVTSQPAVEKYQVGLAKALVRLGLLRESLGQRLEALESYVEAILHFRALVKAQPGVPGHQADLAKVLNSLGDLQSNLGQSPEARQSYSEAIVHFRALVKAHPRATQYRLNLSQSLLGQVIRLDYERRHEEARRHFDEALTVINGLIQSHPENLQARSHHFIAHETRARALAAVGQFRAAVRHWDQALALAPPNARPGLRLGHADALARAGDHARAAEAAALARVIPLPPSEVYDLACVLSLSAAAACRDAALPLLLRDRRANDHARAAVALLHRAAKAGWRDGAHADADSDLDFLRTRPDYRAWRAALPPAKP